MTEQEYLNAKDLGVLEAVFAALANICIELQDNIDKEEYQQVVAKVTQWQMTLRKNTRLSDGT